MINRKKEKVIFKNLDTDEILLIKGARQVGKTTLLKRAAANLKEGDDKVFELTLEDPELLNDLNKHPENIFNFIPRSEERIYLALDEIQYLENPSNFLKYIFDVYGGKIKLVVTGSSAFYLDTKFKDSLAGRKKVVEIYPFSFSEFLEAKGERAMSAEVSQGFTPGTKRQILKPERKILHQYWMEFVQYGGYPRVVLESEPDEKKELLKELVQSFLRKDIYESGIREEEKFYKLVRLLASQAGQLLNVNELANTLDISKGTVSKYLYVLQKSYIIKICPPFYNNIRKELTKMPKFYFLDTGYRNSLLNSFELVGNRIDTGQVLESSVFTGLVKSGVDDVKYWRTQNRKEIDFIVGRKSAFEVKVSIRKYAPAKYKTFVNAYPDIDLQPVVMFDYENLDVLDFVS